MSSDSVVVSDIQSRYQVTEMHFSSCRYIAKRVKSPVQGVLDPEASVGFPFSVDACLSQDGVLPDLLCGDLKAVVPRGGPADDRGGDGNREAGEIEGLK